MIARKGTREFDLERDNTSIEYKVSNTKLVNLKEYAVHYHLESSAEYINGRTWDANLLRNFIRTSKNTPDPRHPCGIDDDPIDP